MHFPKDMQINFNAQYRNKGRHFNTHGLRSAGSVLINATWHIVQDLFEYYVSMKRTAITYV